MSALLGIEVSDASILPAFIQCLHCLKSRFQSGPAGKDLRKGNAPRPLPAVCLVPTEGDDRLPRASTCFNTLFLPAYSCAEVLEARLLQAIAGAQAFDEGERWLAYGKGEGTLRRVAHEVPRQKRLPCCIPAHHFQACGTPEP